jgi:hypothetical protein
VRPAARAAWAVALLPLLVAAGAAPAAAHGTGTNQTAVTSIRPRVHGLHVTVTKDGRWVRVTNTGSAPVFVLGYEGEPYLRVDATGSWRNSRSSTALLVVSATSRNSAVTMTANQAPDWVRLSTLPTVRFHDLRVPTTSTKRHLGSSSAPRVITSWSLPLRVGHQVVTVRGTLSWRPTPAPKGWIIGLFVLSLAFFALLGMAMRHERNQPPRQWPNGAGWENRHVQKQAAPTTPP